MIQRIRTTQSRARVLQSIHDATGEISGRKSSSYSLVARKMLGDVILTNLHTAFLAKAHGGQDEFGDDWTELSQETKDRKSGRPGARPDRRAQWRRRHAELTQSLVAAGMSSQDARDKASELAWGPNTASEGVPIGIDTHRLERSLDPTTNSPNQVRDNHGDTLTLGTDVEYAKFFDAARPIIPDSSKSKRWVRRGAGVLVGMIATRLREKL